MMSSKRLITTGKERGGEAGSQSGAAALTVEEMCVLKLLMSRHIVCVQRGALVYKVQACKTAAVATVTPSPYDSAHGQREASNARYDLTTCAWLAIAARQPKGGA